MLRLISKLEEGIIAFLLVSITLLVFVEVILRFVFNTGLIWMQEVTLLLAAWFVLIGASWCVKIGAHIGVDAVIVRMPPSIQKWVGLFAVSICLVYCGLFFYGAWIYISKLYQIGITMADLPLPRWLPYSMLLVSFLLLAIRFIDIARKLMTGEVHSLLEGADEAKEVLKQFKKENQI